MKVVNCAAELIGNTPLMDVTPADVSEGVRLLAKLETENIGGSVKDRLGMHLVKRALEEGCLTKGGTIIEPTAGNTGIGLAIAAQHYGVSLIVTVPEKFSVEKQQLMQALGAEVVQTPTEEGMKGAIERAEAIAQSLDNSYVPNQFDNPWNPEAYRPLAEELMEQVGGPIDEIVFGGGSGGTFTGVMSVLRETMPDVKGILVQPEGAGLVGEEQSYDIEGIGMDELRSFMDPKWIDAYEVVSDEEAFLMVKRLARTNALLVGSSSGAAMVAAIRRADRADSPKTIVTLFPDRAERYLQSNVFNRKVEKE